MSSISSVYTFAATDTSTWYGKSFGSEQEIETPVSKKKCPCDNCPFANKCAVSGDSCKAFNSWSASGTYAPKAIARFKSI